MQIERKETRVERERQEGPSFVQWIDVLITLLVT